MRTLFVSSAIICLIEIIAFGLLWIPFSANNNIAVIIHLLASTIGSFILSKQFRKTNVPRILLWLALFIFIFLLPLFGAFLILIISTKNYFWAKNTLSTNHNDTDEKLDLSDTNLEFFSAPKHHGSDQSKKTTDLISTLDDDAYLSLLIATRHLPDKEAYAFLKEALTSPFESARLMAFTLKGARDEKLQKELQKKIDKLKIPENHNRAELHLAVAKDYLHQLDIGVVSGNNENLINKAKYHCVQAIKLDKTSAYNYYTLSRILKYEGRNKQAQRAQIKAVSLGLPLERLYATS